jgi:ADP-ribose pyrophosphatase YjhB (NUDIX family)
LSVGPAGYPDRIQRLAAYAVCIEGGRVLLVRLSELTSAPTLWTLPGGGLHHGEDPSDGVLRELEEETGLAGRILRLLGIDSWHGPWRPTPGTEVDFHALRIVYEVEATGGALRHEAHGSTDRAEWFALDRIDDLDRVDLVDVGLGLLETADERGR